MFSKKFVKLLKSRNGNIFIFILSFLFLLLLQLNNLGLNLREKITIQSTLDFSWFSDAIERGLHGYVLGRDFTFTYGPLFQVIYSLPSFIFHVPSYISVALASLISFMFIYLLSFILARFLTKNVFEQIAYILFLFLILGLLIASGSDVIKMIIPLVYALIFYTALSKKQKFINLCFVAALPTVFGAYAYNLFLSCSLISGILVAYIFYKYKNKKKNISVLFILPLIVFWQIIFSLILTHNFDYIRYSFEAVKNVRYALSLSWTFDRSNILLIFPVLLLVLGQYLRKATNVSSEARTALVLLIFGSLLQLTYVLSRSDAGHLLYAVYPSLITFFTAIFFLARKTRWVIVIGFVLYTLVPFKPQFFNTLTPKNVAAVFKIIKEKPSFFTIYRLPNDYYYSEAEISSMVKIIKANKEQVYIYPYDSYILNIANKTINTFALGTYLYPDTTVEEITVTKLNANPPHIILLGVDKKGALDLDDVPNFTRNPLIAKWMLMHYSVQKTYPKFLMLKYDRKKLQHKTFCAAYQLTVPLEKKENISQKIVDTGKQPIFYLDDIRLPYSPQVNTYSIFINTTSSEGLSSLFSNQEESQCKPSFIDRKMPLRITRVSPFLRKEQQVIFYPGEYSLERLSF